MMISRSNERAQLATILEIVSSATSALSLEEIERAAGLGVPRRTLQRRIASLVADGELEPVGQTRSLRYQLPAEPTAVVAAESDATAAVETAGRTARGAIGARSTVLPFAEQILSAEISGGAGFTFEDYVVATYLVGLLSESPSARGLPDRTVVRVAQQQAPKGEPLDDLVVDAEAGDGSVACLRLQVKRALTISGAKSNTDFTEITLRSLQTIQLPTFREGVDRVGAAVGSIADASRRALETMCESARYTNDATGFIAQFAAKGGANAAQRQIINAIRAVFSRAGVADLDATVFRLLRHFVLLQFDLMHEGAEGSASAIAELSASLAADHTKHGNDLWVRLRSIARDGAGRRAEFDRPMLLRHLHGAFRFRGSIVLRSDMGTIESETRLALGEIDGEIDGVRVERTALVASLESETKKNRFTQVIGLAGAGKSVVFGQFATDQKGPVLLIKADRLQSGTWSQHAAALGLACRDPRVLLSEIGASGTPILFIDGLDRIEVRQRRVVTDVVSAIFSEPSLSHWKIVATMRDSGIEPLRDWLPAQLLTSGTVGTVEVGPLSDDEARVLAQKRPHLAPLLFGAQPVQDIARRPFFLDILAREVARSGNRDLPGTEADLMQAWWNRGGYSGEDAQLIKRQNTLVALACVGATDYGRRMPIDQFDAEALASLRKDGIVRNVSSGHTIAFAHDIFFEWAFAQALIRREQDWMDGIAKAGEAPVLGRVVELLSQHVLQRDSGWEENLRKLEQAQMRPQWLRAWLLGPFGSPRFEQAEKQVTNAIFDPTFGRTRKVLVWFQAEKTRPNPLVLGRKLGKADCTREELARTADFLAWPSDFSSWQRLLEWIFSNLASIEVKLRPDVVALFEIWQNACGEFANTYSSRILKICAEWLGDIEAREHPEKMRFDRGPWEGFRGGELKDLEQRLRILILRASRGDPGQVKSYLQKLRKNRRVRHAAFEHVIMFSPTLTATHAQELVEIAAAELLKELPEDQLKREQREERRSRSLMLGSSGISDYEWRRLAIEEHTGLFSPASPLAEPYHSLLRASPEHGLDLIRRICNHAMLAWRQLHRISPARHGTPLALELEFPWGRGQFWGDGNVYRWFRGVLGPSAVECALMALEDWAFSEVDRGRSVDEVIRQVVSGNDCCAVLGIAATVALSKTHVSRATLPLVTSQHLWHWDLQRSIDDKGGMHANLIGGALLARDRSRVAATDAANKRPVRGYELRHLVAPAILSADKELAAAAQAEIQLFPMNLPFSVAEERQDTAHVRALARTAEIWAAMGVPETYVAQRVEEGTVIFHQSPKADDADVKAVAARAVEMNTDLGLLSWARKSFETGRLEAALNVESAIEQIRKLDGPELFAGRKHPGESDAFRASAISGAAAALLEFATGLTADQLALVDRIIERAAAFPEPADEFGAELSSNPQHPCRYAARGLAARIRRQPDNLEAKAKLLGLLEYIHYDVAEEALRAAFSCWSADAGFAWLALDLGLRRAISPSFQSGDRVERNAARRAMRTKELETAISKLADSGGATYELVELPAAWVFAAPPPINDPFLGERHNRRDPIWREPDVHFWPEFAMRVIRGIPLSAVLADPTRRHHLLGLADALLKWTIERLSPPWEEKRSRRERSQADLFEWTSGLARWLAQLAVHLPRVEVEQRILKPIFALGDEDALSVMTPFFSLYACLTVYDAAKISPDALGILGACRDRFLACGAWDRARHDEGYLYGRWAPQLLKELFFQFDTPALGSTRFANGDWSEVETVIPLIDPVVRMAGDVLDVARGFLSICEKSAATYPSAVFMDQLAAMLNLSDGTPQGWHTTQLPGRVATLIQGLAERDHPLGSAMQQQMLGVLDRLVDMGDRRAGALQASELFKNTRLAR